MVQAFIDYEKRKLDLATKLSELEEQKKNIKIKLEVKEELDAEMEDNNEEDTRNQVSQTANEELHEIVGEQNLAQNENIQRRDIREDEIIDILQEPLEYVIEDEDSQQGQDEESNDYGYNRVGLSQESRNDVRDDLDSAAYSPQFLEHFYLQNRDDHFNVTRMATPYPNYPEASYPLSAISGEPTDEEHLPFGMPPRYPDNVMTTDDTHFNMQPECMFRLPQVNQHYFQTMTANERFENIIRNPMPDLPNHGHHQRRARQDFDRAVGSLRRGVIPETFTRNFGINNRLPWNLRDQSDAHGYDQNIERQGHILRDDSINEASESRRHYFIDNRVNKFIHEINKACRTSTPYADDGFDQNSDDQSHGNHNRIDESFDSRTPQFSYVYHDTMGQNFEAHAHLDEIVSSQNSRYRFPQGRAPSRLVGADLESTGMPAYNANIHGESSRSHGDAANETSKLNLTGPSFCDAMDGFLASYNLPEPIVAENCNSVIELTQEPSVPIPPLCPTPRPGPTSLPPFLPPDFSRLFNEGPSTSQRDQGFDTKIEAAVGVKFLSITLCADSYRITHRRARNEPRGMNLPCLKHTSKYYKGLVAKQKLILDLLAQAVKSPKEDDLVNLIGRLKISSGKTSQRHNNVSAAPMSEDMPSSLNQRPPPETTSTPEEELRHPTQLAFEPSSLAEDASCVSSTVSNEELPRTTPEVNATPSTSADMFPTVSRPASVEELRRRQRRNRMIYRSITTLRASRIIDTVDLTDDSMMDEDEIL